MGLNTASQIAEKGKSNNRTNHKLTNLIGLISLKSANHFPKTLSTSPSTSAFRALKILLTTVTTVFAGGAGPMEVFNDSSTFNGSLRCSSAVIVAICVILGFGTPAFARSHTIL